MINSLFMLGSSYNKNRIMSIFFMLGWMAYMIIGSDLSLGLIFPIINDIIIFIIYINSYFRYTLTIFFLIII